MLLGTYSKCCRERLIPYKTKLLCKSCYNNQWKPTSEQNKKRNATKASKARKNRWSAKHGSGNLHRLSRYGLTVECYNSMLKQQNNCCKICLQPFNGKKSPHIDHDHRTGNVRGILCSTCNSGLGMLKDKPFILARTILYLKMSGINGTEWMNCRFVDLI